MPACLSARSSTQRIEASSSTSQTFRVFAEFIAVERKEDAEHGAAGPAVELDQAVVPADEVLCDSEPESGAALPPRHERIENGVLELRGHAWAVVLDLDAGDDAIAAAADARVGERARAQHDSSSRADGLDRVTPEVQQRLDQLVTVEPQARQARVVVALDGHTVRRLRRKQVPHVLHQLVNVHRLLARRLARTEQGIDQRSKAIGLADDHGRVLVQRRVLQLALEELGGAAQAAERILDLVRELPDHRAASAELGEQRVFAEYSLMLRDVGEFHDHAARMAGLLEGRHRHVERAGRSGGPGFEWKFPA